MLKKIRPYLISVTIILLIINFSSPLVSFSALAAPTVTLNTPNVQGENVTFSGNISGLLDLASLGQTIILKLRVGNDVILTQNFQANILAYNFSFSFTKEFNDGKYDVIATVSYSSSQNDINTATKDFTVDTLGPNLVLDTPSPILQNKKNIIISGTVNDAVTSIDKIVMKLMDSNSTPLTADKYIYTPPTAMNNNRWTYTLLGDYGDGTYGFKISAMDDNPAHAQSPTIKDYLVTVDTTQPIVSSVKVNYAFDKMISSTSGEKVRVVNEANLQQNENMNHVVTTDSSIKVIISDETRMKKEDLPNLYPLNVVYPSGESRIYPIELYNSNNEPVEGVIHARNLADSTSEIDKVIELEFIPNSLDYSTTYYVKINSAYIDKNDNTVPNFRLTDAAGNPVYPLIKKFTTERDRTKGNKYTDTGHGEIGPERLYPHGDYTTNTNACANCHSTHTSVSDSLGKQQPSFDLTYSTTIYCMACHDGTVTTVAAAPNNLYQNGHTSNPSTSKNSAEDCSSCHNPHLTWQPENPNMLKDYYEYSHQSAEIGLKDSRSQLCEACHEEDTGYKKDYSIHLHNDAAKTGTKIGENVYPIGQPIDNYVQPCEGCHVENINYYRNLAENGVKNKVLHYRKSFSAQLADTTQNDSYSLCFNCHNSSQAENGPADIQLYYQKSSSKHIITAMDGSIKTGHIPCAECHDTHGSGNIKILKDKLGHEGRQEFTITSGEWDAAKERVFCSKCHNGVTSIYGVTSSKLDPLPNNAVGHGTSDTVACSNCHGVDQTNKTTATTEEKILRSTHAPSAGIIP